MSTTTSRQWGVVEKVEAASSSLKSDVYRLFMDDDGTFPNNPDHPLLLFKSAFGGTHSDGERAIVKAGWTSPWAWGVFPYHHYHSTAWELLLCVRGAATLKLGGESGPDVEVAKGDMILIPPGFVHKQLNSSGGFTLLGAYPKSGCTGPVDTLTGKPTKMERVNIVTCVAPKNDPVLGVGISELY